MQWACRYKCDTEEVTENQPSPHLFQAYICLLIYLGFKQYEYSELKLEPQKNQTVITHQQRTPSRPCRFFFRQGSCQFGESCRFNHVLPEEM